MKYSFLIFVFISNIVLSQRVIGYYPHWVISNLPAEDIDLDIVTHIIHSFAWPDLDGSILFYDGMFDAGVSESVHSRGGKILLSLGGWGNHAGFEAVVPDENLRMLFINNLVDLLTNYDYDGVDLDWEFPDSQIDREYLNLLVSEMDSIFNDNNPNWLISMAIPVSNWYGQWHDFNFLVNHIDFFNAMTYGTHGSWSSHTGHLAPLYSSPPNDVDGSCHTNINYLLNTIGIPKDKVNMGMPFWGVKWQSTGLNQPFIGSTVDIMYEDIQALIGNGWTYYWDDDALCPYLIDDANNQLITYENKESIKLKCEYASTQELGGVMIWALSYDKTDTGQELIQSIQNYYLKNQIEKSSLLPNDYLISVYPNPFNPSINIIYKIREYSSLSINIYDLTGKNLANLIDAYRAPGLYELQWDGRNKFGNTSSAGLYICSIQVGNIIVTKKIVLLK